MTREWKPANYNSVSAYLICAEPEAVIAFAQDVFGAELLRRFDRPDGSIMHCELLIDDTVVMMGGAKVTPKVETNLHVYVEDAEAVYARALSRGAEAVQAPERKSDDDDLRGGFRDPCGNTWWVATQ